MAGGRFDPYAILSALEREYVTYVLIGGLARVLRGSDELTHGLDLTPKLQPETLRRLETALQSIGARPERGGELSLESHDFTAEPVLALTSDHGEIKVVPTPAGTRGYEDLHRAASREYLGNRLRAEVSSPGDLVRMLWVLGRDVDARRIETMQRVVELDRGLGLEL
ncbi:MAG: hypothetical protein H0V40_13090 [Actinobacteria bacterium]|nr:hypothetical protein [Actinomycetota bacterium]